MEKYLNLFTIVLGLFLELLTEWLEILSKILKKIKWIICRPSSTLLNRPVF